MTDLEKAVKALLDECPTIENDWQGVGMYAVKMQHLVDLKRAYETSQRVRSFPYHPLSEAMFGG